VIEIAADSHPGRVRNRNEDAFVTDATTGLFAVADGLGGHRGGDVASRIAIETVSAFVRTSSVDATTQWPDGFNPIISFESNQLRNAAQLANRQIRQDAALDVERDGMGSTLIAAIARPGRAAFVCIGDSRLYLWRKGALTQLSQDDTWIASMIRAGAQASEVQSDQMRHMLTRALGAIPALEVKPEEAPFETGDVLLLCSDGLYDPIGDDGIARVLVEAGANLSAAVAGLIDSANLAGGPDNITAVLIRNNGA